MIEQSADRARELGDRPWLAMPVHLLGMVAAHQGDHGLATTLFDEAELASREAAYAYGVYCTLFARGIAARFRGDLASAVDYCQASLALCRPRGDTWYVGQVLANLGLTRYQQGDYAAARARFEESLAVRRELDDRRGIA